MHEKNEVVTQGKDKKTLNFVFMFIDPDESVNFQQISKATGIDFPLHKSVIPCSNKYEKVLPRVIRHHVTRDQPCDCEKLLQASLQSLLSWAESAKAMSTASMQYKMCGNVDKKAAPESPKEKYRKINKHKRLGKVRRKRSSYLIPDVETARKEDFITLPLMRQGRTSYDSSEQLPKLILDKKSSKDVPVINALKLNEPKFNEINPYYSPAAISVETFMLQMKKDDKDCDSNGYKLAHMRSDKSAEDDKQKPDDEECRFKIEDLEKSKPFGFLLNVPRDNGVKNTENDSTETVENCVHISSSPRIKTTTEDMEIRETTETEGSVDKESQYKTCYKYTTTESGDKDFGNAKEEDKNATAGSKKITGVSKKPIDGATTEENAENEPIYQNTTSLSIMESKEETDQPQMDVWDMLNMISSIKSSFFNTFFGPTNDNDKNHNDLSLLSMATKMIQQLIVVDNKHGYIAVIKGGKFSDFMDSSSDIVKTVSFLRSKCDGDKTTLIITASCPTSSNCTRRLPLLAAGPLSEDFEKAEELPDIPQILRSALKTLERQIDECIRTMKQKDEPAGSKRQNDEPAGLMNQNYGSAGLKKQNCGPAGSKKQYYKPAGSNELAGDNKQIDENTGSTKENNLGCERRMAEAFIKSANILETGLEGDSMKLTDNSNPTRSLRSVLMSFIFFLVFRAVF